MNLGSQTVVVAVSFEVSLSYNSNNCISATTKENDDEFGGKEPYPTW